MNYFDDAYYYLYTVEVIWTDDPTPTDYSGVVLAYSMEDAVKKLDNYYDAIVTIKNLRAIIQGEVFDFNFVNNSNFDFIITQKE